MSKDGYDVSSGLTQDDALGRVQYMACAIINSNIRGVQRKATMFSDGGGIRSSFHFSSLLDVIYWQILNEIEGSTVERCQNCHAPFIKTDKRQRFCPKRYGEAESKCAMQFRKQQYLERHGIL